MGTHVKVSLDTKDRTVAKHRYRSVDAEVQELWQSLRNGPKALTHKDILALGGIAYHAFVEAFDLEPGSPDRWQKVLQGQRSRIHG